MATSPESLDSERRLGAPQLVLVLVGALVLVGVLWFFFLRAEDDGVVDAAAPAPAPVATPEEQEQEEAPAGRGPVETFEVFAPKDPFDPLISAATAGAGSGGATVTGTTTEGGTTTTTNEDGTGTTTTTIDSGDDGGEDVGGHRVRVIDVFAEGGERRAQVQVDGTVYTVDEGERFASNFELLSTSGRCATMLFGDDQFTLCEGEEILK